jgi:hypothetical protein
MASAGLVSITIPVLNAERYLGAALDNAAAQTYTRFENLVVDGGSAYGVTADLAWFAALDALGLPGRLLPDVLLHKRLHAGNYSVQSGAREYGAHLPRLLKPALDLRRAHSQSEHS